jgi:hypothetical protein
MTKSKGVIAAMVSCWLGTTSALAASPQTNYMMACQGCHLADGRGTPGKVPSLKGEIAKFLHVDGGRAFLVQVPGTSQSSLNNLETAEVLNWILTTMDPEHLPNGFVPYSEDEVAILRVHKLTDITSVRERLVAQFPDSSVQPEEQQ